MSVQSSPAVPQRSSPAAEELVHLRRIDPARRMARYYTLSVELTLFDDWSCRREHGRIGQRGGRVMIGLYARKEDAVAAFTALLRAKTRKGYRTADEA